MQRFGGGSDSLLKDDRHDTPAGPLDEKGLRSSETVAVDPDPPRGVVPSHRRVALPNDQPGGAARDFRRGGGAGLDRGRPLGALGAARTDLERSLAFYASVFGMAVIRHEENAAACPITCNGEYATPWSKTMVGYDYEDASYCLELTYNYGVHAYAPGGGLREIGRIAVADPAAAAAAARGGVRGRGARRAGRRRRRGGPRREPRRRRRRPGRLPLRSRAARRRARRALRQRDAPRARPRRGRAVVRDVLGMRSLDATAAGGASRARGARARRGARVGGCDEHARGRALRPSG